MRQLATCADVAVWAVVRCEPNWAALGKRLGKAMGAVAAAVKTLSADDIAAYEAGASLTLAGVELSPGDLSVVREFKKPTEGPACDAAGDGDVLVVLVLEQDESLAAAGLAREAVSRVQRARKAAGVAAGDAVSVTLRTSDGALASALADNAAYLADALGSAPTLLPADATSAAADDVALPPGLRLLHRESAELSSGAHLLVTLCAALAL